MENMKASHSTVSLYIDSKIAELDEKVAELDSKRLELNEKRTELISSLKLLTEFLEILNKGARFTDAHSDMIKKINRLLYRDKEYFQCFKSISIPNQSVWHSCLVEMR